MNFNTLTPTSKLVKKLHSYATGQPVTSGDTPHIAIINAAATIDSKPLVENLTHGIKSRGGAVFTHNVANFGYATKLNPMTAKYAQSFSNLSSHNAEAIIKSNMIDGAVIVADCDVTAAGLLMGCLRANCPAIVLPLGRRDCTCAERGNILSTAGKVTGGEMTAADSENILRDATYPKGQTADCTSITSYFTLLENLGFSVEGASANKYGSGAQLVAATQTGEKIIEFAKDLMSPKKFLTKATYQNVVEFALKNGEDLGALKQIFKLFAANDVKVAHEYIASVASKMSPTPRAVLTKGSACGDGGYVQYLEKTPPTFSGKAWVYENLEDADRALLGGAIPAGSVIVLKNCPDVNVTAFAYAIEGMGRAKDIAIATDGMCDKTTVLAVTMCTPNSLANEEFANIQNGDVLDIDVARGRFNTSILAKDLKTRAKRNIIKKQVVYFG